MRFFHSITIQFSSDFTSAGNLILSNAAAQLSANSTSKVEQVRGECITTLLPSDKK